jgi:hypothetical protein
MWLGHDLPKKGIDCGRQERGEAKRQAQSSWSQPPGQQNGCAGVDFALFRERRTPPAEHYQLVDVASLQAPETPLMIQLQPSQPCIPAQWVLPRALLR